jgi:hypothetical protein
MEAIAAGQRSQDTHRPQLAWLLSSIRGVAAFVLALAALFAGIGILYLIHQTGALGLGPRVHDALPLEQLAGKDSQPLFHLLIAWVPAGFVAGVALIALTRFGAVARTASLTVLAALIMLLAGAISDSVAVNDPLSPHLAPQLSRGGTWIAVALFALGSLCAGLLPPRRGPSRR